MFDWDDILIIGDSYASARHSMDHWPMALTVLLTGIPFPNDQRLPNGIGFPGAAWWSVRNELLAQLKVKIPKVLILCHTDKYRLPSDTNLPLNSGTAQGTGTHTNIDQSLRLSLEYYFKYLFSESFHVWAEAAWFSELDNIITQYQIPYVIHLHCFSSGNNVMLHEFKTGITHLVALFDKNNMKDVYFNHFSVDQNTELAHSLHKMIISMQPFSTGMKDCRLILTKRK
jgi:hypothetical protein